MSPEAFYKTRVVDLELAGLGPASKKKLVEAGLRYVWDLITFLPRTYQDYSTFTPIPKATIGVPVHVQGRVLSAKVGRTPKKNIPYFECLIDDGEGTMRIICFQQTYLAKTFKEGVETSAYGKVQFDTVGRSMVNPTLKRKSDLGQEEIRPVYREIKNLPNDQIRRWISACVQEIPNYFAWPGDPGAKWALQTIHQPPPDADLSGLMHGSHPAVQRMASEEWLTYSFGLKKLKSSPLLPQFFPPLDLADFATQLPFKLTDDQHKVMQTLHQTIVQRNRIFSLLQGDVGSGKTAVALFLAEGFTKADCQTALLCPTTVLANQQFQAAQKLLPHMTDKMVLLTSKMDRQQLKENLTLWNSGQALIAVGTHKLFQKDASPPKLGLVIIDEQHRFGVNQRASLLAKGQAPHYLALSATPIPRSLAMTIYAGYDVHQIKEKPAGRQPIRTVLKKRQNQEEVVKFCQNRMAQGESIFWVVPRIEGEDERSVISTYQDFSQKTFGTKTRYLHGQMDPEESEKILSDFKAKKFQLLVATTVIEVGIDIPHATVMVIDGANHFGLSQLHQLRGRVGRNNKPGFCFLLVDEIDRATRQRLQAFCQTEDGFRIAEIDLAHRGFGSLTGSQQSGIPQFRFLDPLRDMSLIQNPPQRAEHAVLQALLPFYRC